MVARFSRDLHHLHAHRSGRVEVEWTYGGKRHLGTSGGTMLMEPGEVHANSAITRPLSFRVVLIEAALIERAARELGCARRFTGKQLA